jgi:outer membrane lipoprotein-sorting protein
MASRTLRAVLALCLLPAAGLWIGWADTWEGLRTESREIRTVKAGFIQEKHLEILETPLISKGVFYFRTPGDLRWEYTEPIRSILLAHDGKTERYIEGEDGPVKDAAAGMPAMQMMLGEISGWLKGRFEENPDFNARLEPGRKIVLTPKSAALSDIIQRIVLQLSDRPGLIDSVTVHESDTSYTRFRFEDTALNADLDDAVFSRVE